MQGNQRIYFNSTPGTVKFPQNVLLGTTYISYASASTGIQGVVGNGASFLFGSGTGINSFIYAGLQIGRNSTNYLQVAGSATTNPVVISSQGGDNDINIAFSPKGGGLLNVTNSASFVAASNCGSLSTSTGCLAIKDNNSNTVYLPVYGSL